MNLDFCLIFLLMACHGFLAGQWPGACEEGAEIGHAQRCSAFCAAGYVPSIASLECYEAWSPVELFFVKATFLSD